jgi:hypothetical protein
MDSSKQLRKLIHCPSQRARKAAGSAGGKGCSLIRSFSQPASPGDGQKWIWPIPSIQSQTLLAGYSCTSTVEAEHISEHKGIGGTCHGYGLWQAKAGQCFVSDPKRPRNVGLTAMQQRRISSGLFPAQTSWIQTMTAWDVLKWTVIALNRTQEQPKLQRTKKRIAMQIFLEVWRFGLLPMDG